ncbi:MAG: hypothetical protein F4X66_06930 [Chloroflexi bacterium]|nr:hypothetical protein [Chloroflexota bacterium]MYE40001.1 hypothetical protein [Chloroflexota bacterium]
MATFGDLERALADLYPYRWAIGAAVLVLIAAFLAFAWWRGWHRVVWRYRKPLGIVSVPLLAVTLWLGWSLGSPLFTNVTVDEAFPFAATATVPEGMEREEVEEVLSGFSKVDSPVMESMPAPAAIDVSAVMAAEMMGEEDAPVVMTAARQADLEEGMAMAIKAVEADSMEEAAAMTEEGVAMMEEAIEQAEMMAQPAATNQVEAVAMGSFKDADAFHRGSGTATIYRTPDGSEVLRLEDLNVTNGPALHVVLSTHPDPERSEQVKQEGYVDLGDLKGNRGNQNYPIPAGVDTSIHKSVVIYCYPFAVVFSVATLER